MRSLRSLLSLLVTTSLALAPAVAQARFGKASSSSSSRSSSSSSSSSSYHPVVSTYHSASPAYAPRSGGSYAPYRSYGGGYYYPREHYRRGWWSPHPWYAWGFGYYPVVAGPSTYPEQTQPYAPPITFTLGVTGQAVNPGNAAGGGAAGLQLAFEGEHLGFSADWQSYFLQADDGSGTIDRIHLVDANLTFALVSTEHGRLRLEGGLSSAVAPDIAFFGPDFGISGALGLVGPISIDFSLRGVPYPFRKVDWTAGLAIPLGNFALRGGWRVTYLDDAGYVDGVRHQDTYSGPYLGLALAI